MANYNYVAPIEYKSYSDMNKERLAAKAERDALKVQRLSAGDKQRQKYLDQLTGLKTDGWSTAHRDEFQVKVDEARRYIQNTPINQLDFGPVSDALIRMQGLGDSHAKLRTNQAEYETHFGVNAVDSEDDTWDTTTTYDSEGWEKRLNTFNNVGLINYSNGMGDFSNPNYDPKAEPGTEGSFRSIREMLQSQGATIETGPDGKDYANVNGQRVPVNGGAFDVAEGGFGNLWNGDRVTRETHAPVDTYLNFKADGEGSSLFKTLGTNYLRMVTNGEEDQDTAHDKLKANVMVYLTGQDPSASLRASAIRMWENKYQMEWESMNEHIARAEAAGGDIPDIPETPWEMYAEAVAQEAGLKAKPGTTRTRNQTEQDRLLLSFGSIPLGSGQTQESADPQFLRELGDEAYNWELALRSARDPQAILDLTYEEDVLDESGRPVTEPVYDSKGKITGYESVTKRKLKDLGNGVKVSFAQDKIKFDNVLIDNIEVFPQDNLAIVYATGYETGKIGIEAGKKGDVWRYNPLFGGSEGVAPFVVINRFLTDDDGNYVLAKEGQTDSKGNPYRAGQKLPHPDFIRLQGQVDYKMGKISGEPGSLLNKIADAEQRRVF